MAITGIGKSPGIPGHTGLSVHGSDVSAVRLRIDRLKEEYSSLQKSANANTDNAERVEMLRQQIDMLEDMHSRLKDGRSASGTSNTLRPAKDRGIRQPGVGLNYDMMV